MPRWWALLVVFVVAALVLGWRQGEQGIAQAWADPVTQMRAQDEAPYADAALQMAREGDWMTPVFMGRPFLQKSPVLFWATGASLRVFGWHLWALRLPVVLLGALGVTAVFAWGRSFASAVAGAGLLVFTPFWQIFSKLAYTDVPAAAFTVMAMTVVALDGELALASSAVMFGVFGALAILSKSIAGLVPFAAVALYAMAAKVRWSRLLISAGAAVVVLAPWHLYQAVAHPQWFYADYVQVQMLGVGLQKLGPSIFNRSSAYYLSRVATMDPVLAATVLIALPFALWRLWKRDRRVLLVFCWLAVATIALTTFQAKNVPYLVLVAAPLCLFVAMVVPGSLASARVVALAVVLLGMSRMMALAPAPPMAGASAMRAYYAMARDTELVSCQPEDEFYSATLPLPRVRYCYVDPAGDIVRSVPHYGPLGVVMTLGEFLKPSADYAARVRDWHWRDDRPVGTVITLRESGEVAELMEARPSWDFCVPAEWVPAECRRDVRRLGGGHVYLLGSGVQRRAGVVAVPLGW